jgi:hypothetical protein
VAVLREVISPAPFINHVTTVKEIFMSTSKFATFAVMLSTAIGLSAAYSDASAQTTFAEKALTELRGAWVSPKGRTISFTIRDGNAVFQDEVEPAVTLTGAYRQDDAGAGYVLRYTQGFECRYNVTVVGSDGNELIFRLVSALGPENPRFRCFEGSLKRTREH